MIIIGLGLIIYWPKPSLKTYNEVKYSEHFNPLIHPTFFDYNQALKIAQENDRLLLVHFDAYSLNSWLREWPLHNSIASKFIEQKLVYCQLNVERRITELDSSEWLIDEKGQLIKDLGNKNAWIQRDIFDTNAQPYSVLLDPKTETTLQTFSYATKAKNNWRLFVAYYFH